MLLIIDSLSYPQQMSSNVDAACYLIRYNHAKKRMQTVPLTNSKPLPRDTLLRTHCA